MRQFKLFNKDRTVSFDLNSGGILVIDNSTGLGNRRDNIILNTRVRNYLINTANNFQPITLKIVFGVGGKNAYALYNDLMSFIRQHGPEGLVLGYKALKEMIYTDVALVEATKTNKTNFGVLEETFTFDRLTPFYRYKKEEGKSILIKNDYYENILPKITLTGAVRATPEIKVEGVNKINLEDAMVEVSEGFTIRYEKATNTFIFNGTTGSKSRRPIIIPELTDKFVSITRVNLTENKHNATLQFLCYDHDGKIVSTLGGSKIGEASAIMYQHQGTLSYGFYCNGTFEDYRVKVQIAEALPTRNEVPLLLAGKEYLGDGIYVLHRQNGGTLTYSVNTAEYRLFGNLTGIFRYSMGTRPTGEYHMQIWKTKQVIFSSGEIIFGAGGYVYQVSISPTKDYDSKTPSYTSLFQIETYQILGELDVSFRVQWEKGTEATPFINPRIPVAYSDPTDFKQTITILNPLQATDEFVIDAEFKEVKRNGNQAYNEIDKTKNTFPVIPKGAYKITSDQPIMVEWKEWVID